MIPNPSWICDDRFGGTLAGCATPIAEINKNSANTRSGSISGVYLYARRIWENAEMTPTEREHVVINLERTRRMLLNATEPLSESQWLFKPAPDQWSAAECVEHVALVEARVVGAIQKLSAGPPTAADVLAACAGKEEMIERDIPARQTKVSAPEPVRPTGRYTNPADVLALFETTRDRTLEYARTTVDPIRERAFPHIVFGPLDGYQWLLLMAAHTERHLKQLIEVIEAEGRARRTASGL